MKRAIILTIPWLALLSCYPGSSVSEPDEQDKGPISAEPSMPVDEEQPDPMPIPKYTAQVPKQIPRNYPFVVKLCGVPFEVSVSIILDKQYPVGGKMGWDREANCKAQTITGLNMPGKRTLQFALDGKLEDAEYTVDVR